jgi:sulfite oxidase
MGRSLRDIPDISWKYVQQEKAEDMIHVLQFPYNGEPPRVFALRRTVTYYSI